MPWLQLRINTSRESAPKAEFALSRVHAQAVTLEDNADQPIFEPALGETPLWQETRVIGLFEADVDTQEINEALSQALGNLFSNHQWHVLEDKDWEREWMEHYHPIQCASELWICPSWVSPPDPKAVNILLDPGLAFGTGTHPTTFLCLQWLAQQNMPQKEVIDYGCGSGILGIASLLLGAGKAIGVDIDPQALLATRENAQRNGLDKQALPVFFPDKCPEEKVDIVLANILAGPLVELAPQLVELLKPGGALCLSGIIKSQQDQIINTYSQWLDIDHVANKEEWLCISGRLH